MNLYCYPKKVLLAGESRVKVSLGGFKSAEVVHSNLDVVVWHRTAGNCRKVECLGSTRGFSWLAEQLAAKQMCFL